jgi:hypothetical protein
MMTKYQLDTMRRDARAWFDAHGREAEYELVFGAGDYVKAVFCTATGKLSERQEALKAALERDGNRVEVKAWAPATEGDHDESLRLG